MIEEKAKVISVDHGDVWVETLRRSACGQCAVNKGCGTAVIGKIVGNKKNRVRVLNPRETKVSIGDEIVVGIDERALVRGSLVVYMLPLVFMFLFGLLGEVLSDQLNINTPDAVVVVTGLLGLGVGFLLVKKFTLGIRSDSRYQPVLLHRVIHTSSE